MSYDVRMDDNYGYTNDIRGRYAEKIQVPGLSDQYDRQVEQNLDTVRHGLPPFKSSSGLQSTPPNVPNPYLVSRDASYDYGNNYHSAPPDDKYPNKNEWAPSDAIPYDAYAAPEVHPWELGERDLESMFNDYFHSDEDEYKMKMNRAINATQNGVACDEIPYECSEFGTIIPTQEEGMMNQDTYFSQFYAQVRGSEQWTEHELQDCSYVLEGLRSMINDYPEMDMSNGNHLEWVSNPEVTMAVDQQGRSAPMACGVMVVKDIQGKACSRLLRVLYDSGGSKSMCHRRVMPRGARINQDSEKQLFNTLAGTYGSLGSIQMSGMRLPAFDKNRVISDHSFEVFDADCRYDVILGADFLEKVGMNLRYSDLTVEWLGNTIPMQTLGKSVNAVEVEQYLNQMEIEEMGIDIDSYLSAPILEAKYDKWSIDEVIKDHCSHLNVKQQAELHQLLTRHAKLFDGTLGKYPGEPMHIEVEPGATPVYRRPYPVPVVHMAAFKKELEHLVSLGVLSPVRDTEWGLPTFITPKKDGRIRWVSDMRELNKVIKRTQYTLPIINDVLRKRKGYEFLTKLDISMQFYTFELDEESKKLCTIVTPFGPYCYNRVPMGLKISPGYAQARMEEVLRGIDDVDCYIDDIGLFSTSWENHLSVLDEVLGRLEANGFTINPLKCEWGVKETDWLGYWLTPTGLKPWAKKVESILKMKPPTTATELRTFLGMVTYYRDMWPRRSHVLAPFTKLAGLPKKAKIAWTEELDKAFKQMQAVIAQDCLMAYPNHNLPFDIYTDASDYQMGACIMQGGRPVAYYSKKLSPAQKNYTTMEKELLAIVMVMKEYRSMLLGAELNVFTDHRNLTLTNFNTQRVLRWRCFIEEYSPNMFYLEGKLNVLADAFSRLPLFDSNEVIEGKSSGLKSEPTPLDIYHADQDSDLYDCLKHLPEMDEYFAVQEHLLNLPSTEDNPLSYQWLRDSQDSDTELKRKCEDSKSGFHTRLFNEIELVCYTEPGKDKDQDWKIYLTDQSVEPSIVWFHQLLNHPGQQRLLQGMARYFHPKLKQKIDAFKCDACQRYKTDSRGYGHMPARDVRTAPWEQVDVDLIGPWKVQTSSNRIYEFSALTSIDRVTGLAELIRIEDKTSQHVAEKFAESWLSRYPRPFSCCHDNGGEFTGWEFQAQLYDFGIRDVPTTSRNPASNGICERMHGTVGNMLRTKIHTHPPRTLGDAKALVDEALASASHGIRTNVSQVTGYSPGALAFHRDMLLDVPLIADLTAIREKRQLSVDANLRRTNAKRSSYDYKVGQQVLKKRHEWSKLGERWDGPFEIKRVHVNGNVTMALREGVTERINIRRVKPYHTPTVAPIPLPIVPTEPVGSRTRSRDSST